MKISGLPARKASSSLVIRPLATLTVFILCVAQSFGASRPNIIHVFVDDLGWGSVGFNNDLGHKTDIKTPNLDRFATEGMRFTRAYSATVCSPSRAMLMTGMHQGHCDNDRNVRGFLSQDVTIADVLKQAGYHTACIGKWGFGANAGNSTDSNGTFNLRTKPTLNNKPDYLPTNQGFEYFYGYLSHTQAHHYFVDPMWRSSATAPSGVEHSPTGNDAGDGRTNTFSAYSDCLFLHEAEAYVRSASTRGKPFYLQLNFNIPHADFDAITKVPNWDSDYQGDAVWEAWTDKQRKVVAMITLLDRNFGQLMACLENPDQNPATEDSIAEDTLVIFTSDNGSDPGDGLNRTQWNGLIANGPFLGGKRDLYEGGIRVPMVAHWPNVIEAGTQTDFVTDLADFLPTAAELAGARAPVGIDGVSIAPLLTGKGIQRQRPCHVWEHHNLHGVGPGSEDRHPGHEHRWAIERNGIKLVKLRDLKTRKITFEMFDIDSDPRELLPISHDIGLPSRLKSELQSIAKSEGLNQGTGYHAQRRSWTGLGDSDFMNQANWCSAEQQQRPNGRWMATISNQKKSPSVVTLSHNAQLLGLEVSGVSASQTLQITDDAKLSGRNEIRIAEGGVIDLKSGQIASVRWVDVLAGGTLKGSGKINATIFNAGEISPGSSPGRFVISSDYIQLPSGKLSLEIGGSGPDKQFDQLFVDGVVSLEGDLQIEAINGYEFRPGSKFPLIIGQRVEGSFNRAILPTPPPGCVLDLDYRKKGVFLIVEELSTAENVLTGQLPE